VIVKYPSRKCADSKTVLQYQLIMNGNNTKGSMEQLIQRSNNIAIVPSQIGGCDAFAAGLGLFFGLKEKDKKVALVYPGGVPQEFVDLVSNSEIVTDPSLRSLIIEVDYSSSPAEKVNYSTQKDVLTLKISPVDSNFSLDNVRAGLQGAGYDLIFVIGAQVKEDLGVSYSALEEEFRNTTLINLDNIGTNSRFGDVNIIDPLMDNLSQLVLNFMTRSGFFITHKPAKALLRGISYKLVN
jgi:nanoRNase/pAp phosphatase (c-di-AMP/oligoRNAs hydrolase)